MFMCCAVEDMVGSCAYEANRAAPVSALEETWDGDDSVAAKWLVQVLCCWQTLSLLSNWPNAPGVWCSVSLGWIPLGSSEPKWSLLPPLHTSHSLGNKAEPCFVRCSE